MQVPTLKIYFLSVNIKLKFNSRKKVRYSLIDYSSLTRDRTITTQHTNIISIPIYIYIDILKS